MPVVPRDEPGYQGQRLRREEEGVVMPINLERLRRRRDETGASAVEYGLLVAAIAALIVVIVFGLGTVVKDTFDVTCDTINGEVQSVDSSCG
jgi:pilus assembly protein Flp/PilA